MSSKGRWRAAGGDCLRAMRGAERKDLARRGARGERLCPRCGIPVSEGDDVCPLCGAPLRLEPRRSFPWWEAGVLLVVLMAAVLWWRYGASAVALAPSPTPTGDAVAVREPTLTPLPTSTPTPTPTNTPTITPTPTLVFHIVSPGETLLVIANEYEVKVDDIVRANNLPSAQFIRVGQKLLIPEGYVPSTPTPKATAWALNYIVQEGDTLDYIALSFHVPLPTLVAANHFTSTIIHPGDVVIVPQGKPPKELTPTPISGPFLLPVPAVERGVRLLYPPDGAHLSERSPVLRWLASSWLSEDDWYRLRVWKDGDEKPTIELLTRATGWRMDESLRGPKPVRWRWRVEVVKSVAEGGTPTPEHTPLEISPLWSFRW